VTTIFGADISSFQHGLDLSRLTEASFVIAKTTEGTYYTDADYPGWRLQSAALGKLFVWYHFLSGESAAAQAAHTKASVGNLSLPGMLDFEPAGTFEPTLAQAVAYIKAAQAAGLRLVLVYLPHWYWQQLGSPDLSELSTLGVHLVSSAYPGGTGSPAALYPGDGAAGWGAYGGMAPLLYQFTDKATDGGQPLDYNAYRGTVAQLAATLSPTATHSPAPSPTSSEDDVALVINPIASGLNPNGTGAVTVIPVPPPNAGAAGWGNVWFSVAVDNPGESPDVAHLRVAGYINGKWSQFVADFPVSAAADRLFPLGSPLPNGITKISVQRIKGSEDVPVAYMIEARAK
jgi:lysozyme